MRVVLKDILEGEHPGLELECGVYGVGLGVGKLLQNQKMGR